MAIVFGYTPATNIVVVTGGTSGTPATFADFVTADRAGTYTVMDAIATAMNLTLDRLIRPVEFRALKITFTLAGTNAGAGDTVDITGTDAWGNAQNESINVAAGNGAYVSAKHWRTITDIDCTGFADGVGTINAVQGQWGVIWDLGNSTSYQKQYRIDAIFMIGDGFISTYFTETDCQVVFSNGNYFQTTAVSITTFGQKIDNYTGRAGCHIITIQNIAGSIVLNNLGTLNMYSTIWQELGTANKFQCRKHAFAGTWELIQCTLAHRNKIIFSTTPTSLYNVIGIDTWNGLSFLASLTACNIILANHVNYPISIDQGGLTIVLKDSRFNASGTLLRHNSNSILDFLDCISNSWVMDFTNINSTAYRKHTCNIHITDKNGADVQNATIACEDQFGTPVFSVNTDANGNIAEQIITYRRWVGTSETLTTYSPHVFTISKAGYETLELDDVTVDAPIVWHLELLPALAEADVRDAIPFGEDKTGSLDLPSINDVEDGVFFDGATKEGNFEAPAEEDVEVGVGYGSLGTEFEGTYLGLRGENLIAVLEESVALVGYLEKKVDLTGELKP